jgi:hypothetical protein
VARPAYLDGLLTEHRELARGLKERGVGYARVATDLPLDQALRQILTSRIRGG